LELEFGVGFEAMRKSGPIAGQTYPFPKLRFKCEVLIEGARTTSEKREVALFVYLNNLQARGEAFEVVVSDLDAVVNVLVRKVKNVIRSSLRGKDLVLDL
jgi:hypothetical protein